MQSNAAGPAKSEGFARSTWVDPDDAPGLTDEFFARAEIRENGRLNDILRKALIE